MKNTTVVVTVIIALIIGGFIGYSFNSDNLDTTQNGVGESLNSEKEVALHVAMRKLWSDHVWWTREYLVAAVNNAPNADAAATRLLKNQEDIGSAVATYYGTNAGNQLTTLLKSHITIATEIVTAAKADDQAKLNDASKRWQANADEIATFLSQANPNWSQASLQDMMRMHLETTTDELNAIKAKQYTQSITAFDKVYDHINKMADALSDGIIKQFPDKFK